MVPACGFPGRRARHEVVPAPPARMGDRISDGSDNVVIFSIWLGSELINRLEHDGLRLDLLLRGGEKLAEDKMLKPDDLWRMDKTIELFGRDRLHLLAAAGASPGLLSAERCAAHG